MRAVVVVLLAAVLCGCSGNDCSELPALTAERDAARAEYQELVAPGTAPPSVTGPADEAVHRLDRAVADLEEAC